MTEETPALSLWFLAYWKAAKQAGSSTAQHHLLRWLISLGGLGLFGVSIVDSSVIPLPLPGSTDLLLLLLTSHRRTTVVTAISLAACAIAGSLVGGYLTWKAGCKGGEVTLERYIPSRMLGPVKRWVERHGAWSVGLAAVVPPPMPLTPFLLAAGALKVPRGRFLIFYGLGRILRYGLLAWLGLTYGRHVVNLWQKSLARFTGPLLWTYGSLVALGIGYGIWKVVRGQKARQLSTPKAQELA